MQQYLFNATAIWLLSLLFYDAFLRRENFHAYNRFYLLFTLLCGALLPLVQWSSGVAERAGSVSIWKEPAQRIATARQTVITAAAPESSINWAQWITVVYVAGMTVAICLLLIDIYRTIRLYKGGSISSFGNWTIVETGKDHAPFSFRHFLFVNSTAQYSDAEWQMLLAHEQRHTSLMHIADLLVLQIARVVFWFHPLVYVYNRRLLMVQEYQADSTAIDNHAVYGKFLLEQSLLNTAPSVTHSFNRSPIKRRIIMLTQKSTNASKIKMLLLVPIVAIAAGCFTKEKEMVAPAEFVKDGSFVTYRGNKFEYSKQKDPDTLFRTNPTTGEEESMVMWTDPTLIKMNDAKLYNSDEFTTPQQPMENEKSIEEYLLSNISSDIATLSNGLYRISMNEVIVDDKGKVVFYKYNGVFGRDKDGERIEIDSVIRQKLDEKINLLMSNVPDRIPAKLNGKAVNANTDVYMSSYAIEVNDKKATYRKDR